MRTHALVLFASTCALLACATSAHAQETVGELGGAFTLEARLDRSTDTSYPEQQERLARRATTEVEAELCIGEHVCGYHWSATTDDGDAYERDYLLYLGDTNGETSIYVGAGIYEIPGPDLKVVKIVVSRPFGAWTATASLEAMRGETFDDTVGRLEAERTFELSERWTANILAASHYSDYAGVGASGEASLTYWLNPNAGLGGTVEAFAGERDAGAALKGGLRISF